MSTDHHIKPAQSYCGRFAPSPTGPLHFGSLVAALASYLDARRHRGLWHLRIEDIDTPRNVPGAAEAILRTLEAFGFVWDGPVLWQHRRLDAYAAALDALRQRGWVYPCACSRKAIALSAQRFSDDGSPVYPGHCRLGLPPGEMARAWRLRTPDTLIGFTDRLQGRIEQSLATAVGDFVLQRADGLFAYQLAVTVDDAFQGISHVVRGADLLLSTPRQIHLQQCLGLPTPTYAHVPVATNPLGEKWSKQTCAPALVPEHAPALLIHALHFLDQAAPLELARARVTDVWDWALSHAHVDTMPRQASKVSAQPEGSSGLAP